MSVHEKIINLLAQSSSAKHILVVGAPGGLFFPQSRASVYISCMSDASNWMGKAIPDDGEPITLEVNQMRPKVHCSTVVQQWFAEHG